MASDRGSAGPLPCGVRTATLGGDGDGGGDVGNRQGGAVAAGGGGAARKGEEVVVEVAVVMEEKGEEVEDEKGEEVDDEKGDDEVDDEKGDSEEVGASSSHAGIKRQRSHRGRGSRGVSLPHLGLEKHSPVFGRGMGRKKLRRSWGPPAGSKRLSTESYVWDSASEDSENDDNFPSTQTQ